MSEHQSNIEIEVAQKVAQSILLIPDACRTRGLSPCPITTVIVVLRLSPPASATASNFKQWKGCINDVKSIT
jgi:hypothetical protein